MKNALLALASCVLLVAIAACGPDISEEVARRVAEERLAHYCDDFKIDRALLEGPRRIRERDPGYVFEWIAFPNAEPVRVEVWVSETGKAEVGLGAGIERLEGTRRLNE
jgi:hypothetical protein